MNVSGHAGRVGSDPGRESSSRVDHRVGVRMKEIRKKFERNWKRSPIFRGARIMETVLEKEGIKFPM